MSTRQTIGRGLDPDETFLGLLDRGLPAEKFLPCFSSEGLATLVPAGLERIATEKDASKLGKSIGKQMRAEINPGLRLHLSQPLRIIFP